MRVFAAFLFSSAVVLAPVLATAQTTPPPTAPTSPMAAATNNSGTNPDEIVCKNQPPATGSRLGGGRECHTQREWDQRQKDAQDITRKEELQGYNRPGG